MIEHNIINVINLEHRDLRLQQFHEESIVQGFGYRTWPGIIIKGNNRHAINLAHRQIVQYAQDHNLKYVAIAEDDCRFFAPGAWKYFMEKMPDDFDIYFSMYYAADSVSENRITGLFSGMTMYIVHKRFYETFLSLPNNVHIDREMLGPVADQYKFIFCDQVVCEQDGSQSDNTKTTSGKGYRAFLRGRKIFGDINVDEY